MERNKKMSNLYYADFRGEVTIILAVIALIFLTADIIFGEISMIFGEISMIFLASAPIFVTISMLLEHLKNKG